MMSLGLGALDAEDSSFVPVAITDAGSLNVAPELEMRLLWLYCIEYVWCSS